MKKTAVIAAIVVASTLALAAQTPTMKSQAPAMAMDHAAIEKALVANENKINDAVAKHDAAAFTAVVSADAWSIDGGGIMSVADFLKNLAQVKIEAGWKITETKVQWLDDNTAVLMYRWTGKGTFMGQAIPSDVYASSLYVKRGGKWMAMFHQESAATPPPVKK